MVGLSRKSTPRPAAEEGPQHLPGVCTVKVPTVAWPVTGPSSVRAEHNLGVCCWGWKRFSQVTVPGSR